MESTAVNPRGTDPQSAEPELMPPDLCRCAACGYRLGGLPRVGRCPECGAAFDRREVVLVGRPAGPRQAWWARQPGPLLLAQSMAAGLLAWTVLGGGGDPTQFMFLTAAGTATIAAAVRFVRRHQSSRTHEAAVRITARGVGAAVDPPDVAAIPLTPWFHVTRLRLVPKRNGRLWIWVRCGHSDLFDVLVECPSEHLPVLQRIIGRWFNA